MTKHPSLMTDRELKDVWSQLNEEGYQKKISEKLLLHENSKELVCFIKDRAILKPDMSIHEIGCGAGRNLSYLLKDFPDVALSGNDLDKRACFQHMDEGLKQRIIFYEEDTLKFLQSLQPQGPEIDVVLVSDHLMHLSRQIIEEVYRLIAKCARKHVILREPRGSGIDMRGRQPGKQFIWAADDFDHKFLGFELKAVQACTNPPDQDLYSLMHFERKGLKR